MAPLLRRLAPVVLLGLLAFPSGASAADLNDPSLQWLPSADGAQWVYAWSDSAYSPTPRQERITVTSRTGSAFRLSWQEIGIGADDTAAAGLADYKNTDAGLVNTNYQSTQPPSQFPVLCASASNCGNSMAGTEYLLFWGTRSPLLAQPLVTGTRWNALGGADNDVASVNRYMGRHKVVVPAFPKGVMASRVDSDVTQAGAIGDPYGSGVRSVYWVYGVGPVLITFRHAGGEVSRSALQSTTLRRRTTPSDANLMPLDTGSKATFRWRNSQHLKSWSTQRFTVSQVVNNTARVDVKQVKGPINVAGSYIFSSRLSGVTNLSTATKAATRAKFPALGPRHGANGRRHFFTPYDLMVYGFNPVIPAYPAKGDSWRSSRDSRDWRVFGVTGVSTVIGRYKVKVPAGKFRAYAVRSTLRQAGFPFGSGTRTSYFAPGKGLVKLVFRHADGSVSTVERTR
jgi:hypothetical protein